MQLEMPRLSHGLEHSKFENMLSCNTPLKSSYTRNVESLLQLFDPCFAPEKRTLFCILTRLADIG